MFSVWLFESVQMAEQRLKYLLTFGLVTQIHRNELKPSKRLAVALLRVLKAFLLVIQVWKAKTSTPLDEEVVVLKWKRARAIQSSSSSSTKSNSCTHDTISF